MIWVYINDVGLYICLLFMVMLGCLRSFGNTRKNGKKYMTWVIRRFRKRGDHNRFHYWLLIHNANASDMMCDTNVSWTINLKPYMHQKEDTSWSLRRNQTNDPPEKGEFILRFMKSHEISTRFSLVHSIISHPPFQRLWCHMSRTQYYT